MTIRPIKSQLIVHQEQPLNAEPPGDLLRQSFLTPEQHFYVRTHGSIPAVDPTSYRLLITGLVQRKRELSLDELRSMSPVHTSGRQHGAAFPYERCCGLSEWRPMLATSLLPLSMRRNLRGKR